MKQNTSHIEIASMIHFLIILRAHSPLSEYTKNHLYIKKEFAQYILFVYKYPNKTLYSCQTHTNTKLYQLLMPLE